MIQILNFSNFLLISSFFQDGISRYSFHSKIDFELWLFVNKKHRIPHRFPWAGLIIRRVALDSPYLSPVVRKFPRASPTHHHK